MSTCKDVKLLRAIFSRISIVKKMVIGYFIIIFLPVILFGLYYYNQLYDSMIEEYASSKQQIIEQAYANLRIDLLQIEANYGLFQYNSNVIDYLNGVHQANWEYVYAFHKHINPLLTSTLYGNSNIQAMRIYKQREDVFTAPELIVERDELPQELQQELQALIPGSGKWYVNESESNEWSLTYYQNMYAERFSKQVGVLAIVVDAKLLQNFIATLSNEGRSEVIMFTKDFTSSTLPVRDDLKAQLQQTPSDYFFLDNKSSIVNHLQIDELGLRVAVVSQAEDTFVKMNEMKLVLITTITALLLLLSGIYYWLTISVMKRLSRLAKHMKYVGENNFKTLDHQQDQDEIGYLTYTYNSMLQRIDELVNKVQRSELLHKEVAYKVLQAQVKPHFLYNTLETIRMLAETNDDHEVAEIAYSFGQLMRYSLSHDHDQFTLKDEVKNIDHYMRIQKIRLGKRLEYSFMIDIDLERIPCPQFILQPLIENCIVHGLAGTRRPCKIATRIYEQEHHVIIDISDDGVGIPEERLDLIRRILVNQVNIQDFSTHEGGHGLYNVSERIKAYYGEDSRLELESRRDEGTMFTLYLNKRGIDRHAEIASSG